MIIIYRRFPLSLEIIRIVSQKKENGRGQLKQFKRAELNGRGDIVRDACHDSIVNVVCFTELFHTYIDEGG